MKDILPQEAKINCFVGHGRAGLKKNKYPRSTGGYGLDVAGYGRSGPEKSWTVLSLLSSTSDRNKNPLCCIAYGLRAAGCTPLPYTIVDTSMATT